MVLATTERCGGGNLQKLNYGSFGEPLWSWPQQKGAAAGIFKNLTMDPSESPCRLQRPSTTSYGNLGNGRPPPPQNNVEQKQLRSSEKIFLDLRRRLLSPLKAFPQLSC